MVWGLIQSGVSIGKVRKYLEGFSELCNFAFEIELKMQDLIAAEKAFLYTILLSEKIRCQESLVIVSDRLL